MGTVQEIRSAIARLPLEERAALVSELCGWMDDDWDRKMKADALSGKFAQVNEDAAVEYRAIGRFIGDAFVWEWIGSHADYDKRW